MDILLKQSPEGNYKLAVPRGGRLYERVMKTLKGSGFEFHREQGRDVAFCYNFPITLIFLAEEDITMYVAKGNVDVGITSIDLVKESSLDVNLDLKLGFGAEGSLCVQSPKIENHLTSMHELAGKRIITKYPTLTKKAFREYDRIHNVTSNIECGHGSLEAACELDIADAIVDVVHLKGWINVPKTNLVSVNEIVKTEAVMISKKDASNKPVVDLLRVKINEFIQTTKNVKLEYKVSADQVEQSVKAIPNGMGLSILSLINGQENLVSILVSKEDVIRLKYELQHLGAKEIVAYPLYAIKIDSFPPPFCT